MWGEKSWALWHKKGVKVQGGPGGYLDFIFEGGERTV